ncbi:unnamed protein product [Hymenolepis diminuta]|uniref:Uncharacterized protein n=1 Tax=Hymenolepis diminuta TaxID=6216 RepID=A0A564ZDL9_HYMDI|nr:unnamed protein product [Hymenolepis diminuta]
MPKVIPTRLVSKPTEPKRQSVQKFYLLDHQTNQISHLKGDNVGFCTFVYSRTHVLSPRSNLQTIFVSVTIFDLDQGPFSILSDPYWWVINAKGLRKSVLLYLFLSQMEQYQIRLHKM